MSVLVLTPPQLPAALEIVRMTISSAASGEDPTKTTIPSP